MWPRPPARFMFADSPESSECGRVDAEPLTTQNHLALRIKEKYDDVSPEAGGPRHRDTAPGRLRI
ncbi:hypothetical protein GCM10009796_25620 [Microbacterium koreense]